MSTYGCPESDLVILNDGDKSVVVHLHGATIISWKVKGQEHMFMSKTAIFDNKKGIRGGVPFVFPNFGPWKLGPQHGFARTTRWTCAQQPAKQSDSSVTAVLELRETPESLAMWNYKFLIRYTVELKPCGALGMRIEVSNEGDDPFDFTLLFHTYFDVPDVEKIDVDGFKGLAYIDKNREFQSFVDDEEALKVTGPTDRIYGHTPNEHVLRMNTSGRPDIKIVKENLPDTVVWNPWDKGHETMNDFHEGGHKTMVCVETGKVVAPVTLGPKETYDCTCILSLV